MKHFQIIFWATMLLAITACQDGNDFDNSYVPSLQSQSPYSFSTSASPTTLTFSSDGGSQTITVNSNEQWTASIGSASWCSLSKTSGKGSDNITVTTSKNTTSQDRTATITIKGSTSSTNVSVVQETVMLDVSPTSLQFERNGGSQTIDISCNTSWIVTSSESWCTVSTAIGINNASVTVAAKQNTSISPRTATITVTCDGVKTAIVSVEQAAGVVIPGDEDNGLPKQW